MLFLWSLAQKTIALSEVCVVQLVDTVQNVAFLPQMALNHRRHCLELHQSCQKILVLLNRLQLDYTIGTIKLELPFLLIEVEHFLEIVIENTLSHKVVLITLLLLGKVHLA
jgi:hypothetical protein